MPEGEIRGRLEGGQLHRLWAGVYAVGRPDIGRLGRFKAATLVCGAGAQLSHGSAADLWRIRRQADGPIDVAVPSASFPRRRGIRLHRRANLGPPRFVRGIPVADPVSVLIDLAAELSTQEVSAITAPPPSRRWTSAATRPTRGQAYAACASPIPRSSTVPITSAKCSSTRSATFTITAR